jgi:RES domain-containing protein
VTDQADTVVLWRIASQTRKYDADDRSGGGAASQPGRWNQQDEPMLYTSPSIALATLETVAHLDPNGLPLNRFLVRISVPAAAWESRVIISVEDLPVTWSATPAGATTAKVGSAWLASEASLLMQVPSVIVPEESNVLINPRHPDIGTVTAKAKREFDYFKLFRRQP